MDFVIHCVLKVLGVYPKGFGKPLNILSKGNYSDFPISIELLLEISGTRNLVIPPAPPSCLLHLDKHFSWGASSQV